MVISVPGLMFMFFPKYPAELSKKSWLIKATGLKRGNCWSFLMPRWLRPGWNGPMLPWMRSAADWNCWKRIKSDWNFSLPIKRHPASSLTGSQRSTKPRRLVLRKRKPPGGKSRFCLLTTPLKLRLTGWLPSVFLIRATFPTPKNRSCVLAMNR